MGIKKKIPCLLEPKLISAMSPFICKKPFFAERHSIGAGIMLGFLQA